MKKKLSVFLFVNLLLNINNLFAQANHANNISGSSTSLTEPLGWLSATGSSNDLDIINQWNSKNINFHTMIGTNFSRKMQLLNTGEFGIGTAPFTPAFKLDVDGDVNINDIYSGFKIGSGLSLSRYVLWYNGNESNIFVGTLAGLNCVTNYNAFVGHDAGANTGVSGDGESNTFMGYTSGKDNNQGSENVFYGAQSGGLNQDGSRNTFVGFQAGQQNVSGNDNVYIGYNAQPYPIDLENSIAIGSLAQANADNKIILGYNDQYVGIGLSDDINFNGPRSQLEINADPNDTDIPTNPTAGSGLQFRQLTSASPTSSPSDTWVAPYGQVLTVDPNGKVKLTDGGGIPFAECGTVPYLTNNVSTHLNNKSIYYEGNNNSTGTSNDIPNSIGIGYNCGDILKAKLSVYQKATLNNGEETTAGYFHNESEDYGGNGNYKRGLLAISNGYSNTQWNIAGDFHADSASTINIAVRGLTGNPGTDYYIGQNIGGSFLADYGVLQNIGVEAYAFNTGGTSAINYGIFAAAATGGCPGPFTCANAAGYFSGDVFVIGGTYKTSDSNLKDNIESLHDPLSVIQALEPKTYTFKASQYPYLNLPSGPQTGLIAQDVETILPNVVKHFIVPVRTLSNGDRDNTGAGQSFKSIDYEGIIPYLIGAINQQQKNIDSLINLISDAQAQIDNCCHSNHRGTDLRGSNNDNEDSRSAIDVELSDAKTIILDQNTPNPFSEETFITYVIPNSVSKAQIIIFDKVGNVLRTVDIPERGEGILHVYSEKLSSGVYSYSLVADGQTIDTKKMVCEK